MSEYKQHLHDAAIVSKKEEGPKTVSLNQVRLPYDIGYVPPETGEVETELDKTSNGDTVEKRRGRPKKNAENDQI